MRKNGREKALERAKAWKEAFGRREEDKIGGSGYRRRGVKTEGQWKGYRKGAREKGKGIFPYHYLNRACVFDYNSIKVTIF